jgi:hypothetical protein
LPLISPALFSLPATVPPHQTPIEGGYKANAGSDLRKNCMVFVRPFNPRMDPALNTVGQYIFGWALSIFEPFFRNPCSPVAFGASNGILNFATGEYNF